MKYQVMQYMCGSTILAFNNQYSSKVEGKSLAVIEVAITRISC